MSQAALLEQLAAPENLLTAWRAVRGNIPSYRRERSAGPDGVTLVEFERDLPAQLEALRATLVEERYVPQAPMRFQVARRGGGYREVAVLAVVDRVAQRAAQQALEPLWEPEFLECSFGFRPGRSLEQAVACASHLRAHGCAWAVDGDIAACFDSLDHELLAARVKQKVHDGRVIALLQRWLDAGVAQAGLPSDGPDGLGSVTRGAARWMQRVLAWEERSEGAGYGEAQYEDPRGPHGLPLPAVRQLAEAGLMLGLSGARAVAQRAGTAGLHALRTPAGRRTLRTIAAGTGGVAGAAAAAALAAYWLYRRAGPVPIGTLQGSPLSPLLANIYLHPFDVALTQQGHRLVRYADDWVVLCPERESAETAYRDALSALARLRLKANLHKTRILAPDEKLEWLGQVVR